VVYEGDFDRKESADFLCIGECKIGYLCVPDVEKLRQWLMFLDACPYGLVFGSEPHTDGSDLEGRLVRQSKEDDWYALGSPVRLSGNKNLWRSFSLVIQNPQYKR